MELPKNFRMIWWVMFLVMTSVYLLSRWSELQSEDPTPSDLAALAVWVALMAIPIFAEIELFGVKLSQMMGEVKGHVTSEVESAKAAIITSISNSGSASSRSDVNVTLNHGYGFGTPKDQADVLAKFGKASESFGVGTPTVTAVDGIGSLTPDEDYLVRVRIALDREIRLICAAVEGGDPPQFDFLLGIARDMYRRKVITDYAVIEAVTMVYTYCTLVVHGLKVDDKAVKFVKDTAPKLIATLQAIKNQAKHSTTNQF